MKALLYHKDTEAHCSYCLAHVFTFSQDIFSGSLMSSTEIYQDKGQAPWAYQEKLICRNCGKPLNEKLLIFSGAK